MLGVLKNVEIPLSGLENALDGNTMFDGSSIEGFVRIQEADMFLVPDLNTWLVLSYENNKYGKGAKIICDVYKTDGTTFEGCPRYVLKKNLNKMREIKNICFPYNIYHYVYIENIELHYKYNSEALENIKKKIFLIAKKRFKNNILEIFNIKKINISVFKNISLIQDKS